MTVGGRYVLGVGGVAATTAALSLLFPTATREGIWFALGAGLVIQAPLGWWLVRAMGTERFLLVWAGGIAARFATLALGGLVVVPKLGLELAPTLFGLVGVLMAFVAIDVIVVRPGPGIAGAAVG